MQKEELAVHLYPLSALVTCLALLLYMVVTMNVARARYKFNIQAPAVSGDPNFERIFRVQQNTLESLVFFFPALWIFTIFVDEVWAAILGFVWVIGRAIFAWGYSQAAEKRSVGFGISLLSSLALLIGSIVGVVQVLMKVF
jgi:glutathione S-transferase